MKIKSPPLYIEMIPQSKKSLEGCNVALVRGCGHKLKEKVRIEIELKNYLTRKILKLTNYIPN